MATIQFDVDPIQRAESYGQGGSSGVDDGTGIVFSRTRSLGNATTRNRSQRRRLSTKSLDDDDPEYSGLQRPGDEKTKQVFSGKRLMFLAYQSIGVIYGDIGTSLYMSFHPRLWTRSQPEKMYSAAALVLLLRVVANDTPLKVIGVLSLVIWSLILMVTVKYVFIVLRADNQGEGGTFSCYSLLSRYANITHRDPREEPLVKLERWKTEDMHRSNLQVRKTMEKSRVLQVILKIVGVLAVSMVMADGILTPAQSILGAVQGLDVVVPSIGNGAVVGTTCGILVLLFAIQPFGTTKIGASFAPIVLLWLGMLAAFGIYNLVNYDWRVLKAFNPAEGIEYLIRNGTSGWKSLGGVLLAFTGLEALFADLGAFSMRAIQISWLFWTFPCLLLAYIGQAAYLAVIPSAYTYPVFYTAPPGCVIFSLVVAILAAIVASQAIITATFQLLAQIIKLSYFPQIEVIHTSKIFHNQLYVPLANYLMLIGTVVVTAVFRNTTSLGQAYGVCVMFVTFFDTTLVTITALIVWRIRPWIVFLPWLIIACLDGTFLSAALVKVPHGAWFTIMLASALAATFILWRFGKEQQWKAEAVDRHSLSTFINKDEDGTLRLAGKDGGEALSITRGLGIFFDKGGIKTPLVFSQYIGKLVSAPQVIVFFHMRALEYPTVPADDRFVVSKLRYIPNCYRVVLRYGFMDEVITPDLASIVFHHLRDFVVRENAPDAVARTLLTPQSSRQAGNDPPEWSDSDKPIANAEVDSIHPIDLAELQRAYDHRVLYVIGKEEMAVKPGTSIWRNVLLRMFLFLREYSRTKMSNIKVPTDKLVQVGFVKEV